MQCSRSAEKAGRSALSQPTVAGGLLWTALASTALTVLLQTRALSKLPASDSSVIAATEPLWAATLATVLLGEQLDGTKMLGGVLILTGCLSNALLPPEWAIAPSVAVSDDGHGGHDAGARSELVRSRQFCSSEELVYESVEDLRVVGA